MTNADWWARVVQARTEHDDLIPRRVWTLRNGSHEAAIGYSLSLKPKAIGTSVLPVRIWQEGDEPCCE
jgi:hypothetical protein